MTDEEAVRSEMVAPQEATPDTTEAETAIQTMIDLAGPILSEMYRKAAEGEDMWLKKRSLKIITDWIMSLQDTATLLQQQMEAAVVVIQQQNAELEELRPVKKVWTPGL